MKTMHLLYAGGVGGIETLCKHIATYENRYKNYFVFVHAGGPIYEEMVKQGQAVCLWNLKNSQVVLLSFKINDFLEKQHIDRVIIHHPAPLLWLAMLLVMRKTKKTTVIVYAHNSYLEIVSHTWWKSVIYQRLLKRCTHVIAISNFVKQSILKNSAIAEEKITVIYNGIPKAKQQQKDLKKPGEPLRLLYVGRLIPEKGVQVLLEAMTLLKKKWEYQLTIVGDGPYKETLEALAKEYGIQTLVSFAGMQRQINPFLLEADLFVHPAIWEEGFGITLIEAMAQGVCCVAFQRGAIPEIITDGENGFLVSQTDARALADKLEELWEKVHRTEFDKMQKKAIARADDFGMEKFLEQLYKLLQYPFYEKDLDYDRYRCFGKSVAKYKALMDYRYRYIYCWRKVASGSRFIYFYKLILKILRMHTHIEIPYTVQIGKGFSMDHAYNITINSQAKLGENVTMYKGSTIGADHKGVPVIGNDVYIGLNAAVIGNIRIGNDVLIAANAFVNFDVPNHSVVIGNPGKIHYKQDAVKGYLLNIRNEGNGKL